MSLHPFASWSRLRAFLLLALALCGVGAAHAQITVDLQIKRRLFMMHEPILATVLIQNNAGRDIMFADTEEGGQWFSFTINLGDGRSLAPRDLKYELEPLQIKAGQSVKKTVNLNDLFPLGDYGTYRVKANIYFPDVGKYFSSKSARFDVMEGKVLSRQTVGVPPGQEGEGDQRQMVVLSMEQEGTKMLYARVEGLDDGIIYGCYNLGKIVQGIPPDVQLDAGNNLAILQLTAPKTFLLSRVGVNGTFIGQSTYVTPKSQPFLRKLPDGQLQIVGAIRQGKIEKQDPINTPKVSDRPPGF